ncbi:hypothetical protein EYF80_044874 [Liparis tanakae]|uniref:Uncharacterized protein n=1 Tax=Liparis tanakae TaxID=230148 RepID=A0A4Z2FUT9_9TELE|nr:hypothetical protein EYF80_044874 [Liparis tanakae]
MNWTALSFTSFLTLLYVQTGSQGGNGQEIFLNCSKKLSMASSSLSLPACASRESTPTPARADPHPGPSRPPPRPEQTPTQARADPHQTPTLLHGDVRGAGVGGLQQLLVALRRLVEQLHQQRARLLVLAAPDGGQLVQLLLHQPGVVQRVF